MSKLSNLKRLSTESVIFIIIVTVHLFIVLCLILPINLFLNRIKNATTKSLHAQRLLTEIYMYI